MIIKTLNPKLILQSGLIWGGIGILLILVVVFLGDSLPLLPDDPFAVGVYGSLFAGVYFAYKNAEGSLLVNVIGGTLSGIITGLLMLLVAYIAGAISFDMSDAVTRTGIVSALLAGLFGALAVQIIKRFSPA
jgi:hypothetical protein